ncbi:unnamed protein product [Owenia fusiformis]|uniref:Uncharacterized protein n=1 Tax=Owenia fusiformis TaxID=6347 RepID=A0A8J1XX19_OWEFU|nr:unnamed protein product [Owenia fusiformis]
MESPDWQPGVEDLSQRAINRESPKHSNTSESRSISSDKTRNCSVCGSRAAGVFFGVLTCWTCKTFFIRHQKAGAGGLKCDNNGQCKLDLGGKLRRRCAYCRYKKCIEVGMRRKERAAVVVAKMGQRLCLVCGDIASGVHFGIVACLGCTKFFRRTIRMGTEDSYMCYNAHRCVINPQNRNTCPRCRLDKCKRLGMSLNASKFGRPRKKQKETERKQDVVTFTLSAENGGLTILNEKGSRNVDVLGRIIDCLIETDIAKQRVLNMLSLAISSPTTSPDDRYSTIKIGFNLTKQNMITMINSLTRQTDTCLSKPSQLGDQQQCKRRKFEQKIQVPNITVVPAYEMTSHAACFSTAWYVPNTIWYNTPTTWFSPHASRFSPLSTQCSQITPQYSPSSTRHSQSASPCNPTSSGQSLSASRNSLTYTWHSQSASRDSPVHTRHSQSASWYSPSFTRCSQSDSRHNPISTRYSQSALRYSPTSIRHSSQSPSRDSPTSTWHTHSQSPSRNNPTSIQQSQSALRNSPTYTAYSQSASRYTPTFTRYSQSASRYTSTFTRYSQSDSRYTPTFTQYSQSDSRYNPISTQYSQSASPYSQTSIRHSSQSASRDSPTSTWHSLTLSKDSPTSTRHGPIVSQYKPHMSRNNPTFHEQFRPIYYKYEQNFSVTF